MMRISSVKIGFVTLCLISFIGIYVASSQSSDTLRWQSALNVVSEELLQRIIEENTAPGFHLDKEEVRALKIQHSGQPAPLYLIDFRTSDFSQSLPVNPLCGASACAFFGYIRQGNNYQRVLSIYLNPHLPPNIPLVQTTDELQNHLPVLSVKQLEDTHIRQLTLSFNENEYEVTETKLLSQSYD
jgi:hypothetical protein